MKKIHYISTLVAMGIAIAAGAAVAEDELQKRSSVFPEKDSSSGLSSDSVIRGVIKSDKSDRHSKTVRKNTVLESAELPSNICAYLGYYNDKFGEYANIGFNSLKEDGSYEAIWQDPWALNSMPMSGAYIKDGKLCGFTYFGTFGFNPGDEFNYMVRDIATGEALETTYSTNHLSLFVPGVAYVPSSNEIYGFTFNSDCRGYNFSKADADNPLETCQAIVADVPREEVCLALCYNEYEDVVIGVNGNSDLVEIDRFGRQTVIMDKPMGIVSQYVEGLVYVPSKQIYLYNGYVDGHSSLFSLSPEKDEVKIVKDYENDEEFFFFFTDDTDDSALARPEIKSVSFSGSSRDGNATWVLPSKTVGGSEVDSEIEYSVLVDGQLYSNGSSRAGNEVSVDFNEISDGIHTFSLVSYLNGKRGMRSNVTQFVGYDVPRAPQQVTFTSDLISWQPVTGGIYGGNIDLVDLKYMVYVDGQIVATTSETSASPALDPEKLISRHTAYVVATSQGLESEPTHAEPIIYGKPYPDDFHIQPSLDESMTFRVIDSNNDTYVWMYQPEWQAFVYSWDSTLNPDVYNDRFDGDDWLIFPAVDLSDNQAIYLLDMLVGGHNESYPESYEIWLGDSPEPESMKTLLFDSGIIHENSPILRHIDFCVPESGTSYFGIHATSPSDHDVISIRDISLKSVGNVNGPASITECEVSAAENGALSATLSVKIPTVSYNGNPLPSDETVTVEATAASTAIVSGKPGETVIVNVETRQGENTINLNCSTSAGLKGCPASFSVFTGIDIPLPVSDLKAIESEDNMSVTFTWTPSDKGVRGGYVDLENVTYYYSEGVWFNPDEAIELGRNITEKTVEFSVDRALGYDSFSIAAKNSLGEYEKSAIVSLQTGRPLEIPIIEDWGDGFYPTYPICGTVEDPGDGLWTIFIGLNGYEEGRFSNESDRALMRGAEGMTPFWIAMPKISTVGTKSPAYILNYFAGDDQCEVEVYARLFNRSERVYLGSTANSDAKGWTEAAFEFPQEILDKEWVEINLKFIPKIENARALFDRYEMREYHEVDCGIIKFNAPERFELNNSGIISAQVHNYGSKVIAVPEINCWIERGKNKLDATFVGSDRNEIRPCETAVVEFELKPDANFVGSIMTNMELIIDDANLEDNQVKIESKVMQGRNNTVTDLRNRSSEEVHLYWSAPLSKDSEGFENEVHGQLTGTISSFLNVDVDGLPVTSFPWIPTPHKGEPAAWMVWDQFIMDQVAFDNYSDSPFAASEGSFSAVAFCPADEESAADDWLVSPRVKGGSEISFDLAAGDNREETLEVLVSTTTDELKSFYKIGEIKKDNKQWENFSFVLPSDARYFAIRYVSCNAFAVFLDNINFTADTSDIDCYVIIRNGDRVADTTECKFDDTEASSLSGVVAYNVVPVMKDGTRGTLSNTVRFSANSSVGSLADGSTAVSGNKDAIIFTGFDGFICEIFDISGKRIATVIPDSSEYSFSIASGVYIVKVDGMKVKVIVR